MKNPRCLIDTNIYSYIAKHNLIHQHFIKHPREYLAMSVVTLGKLRHGTVTSKSREKAAQFIPHQLFLTDDCTAQGKAKENRRAATPQGKAAQQVWRSLEQV